MDLTMHIGRDDAIAVERKVTARLSFQPRAPVEAPLFGYVAPPRTVEFC